MEYYLTITRNKILIHATTGMNLENIMVTQRSQTQKTTVVSLVSLSPEDLTTEGFAFPFLAPRHPSPSCPFSEHPSQEYYGRLCAKHCPGCGGIKKPRDPLPPKKPSWEGRWKKCKWHQAQKFGDPFKLRPKKKTPTDSWFYRVKTCRVKLQLYFLKSTPQSQLQAICTRINCIPTRPKRVQPVSDKFYTNLKFYFGEQSKIFLTKYISYSVCFHRDCQEHTIQSHVFHCSNFYTLHLVKLLRPASGGAAIFLCCQMLCSRQKPITHRRKTPQN